MPGGRPTKRDDEITAKISEAFGYGLSHDQVAALVGISHSTLSEWKLIPEFQEAIEGGIAAQNLARLKRIELGGPGWVGSAWIMERLYPDRWAKPEVQIALRDGPSKPLNEEETTVMKALEFLGGKT
jgi:hypothetical protein